MSVFPLAGRQDGKKFSETFTEDPVIATDTEGGYVITRARYTRAPRREFKTGFTDLSNAEKTTLWNFYIAQRGGSASFSWTHPVDAVTLTVRFKADAIPNAQRRGAGNYHRWDIDNIVLQEV